MEVKLGSDSRLLVTLDKFADNTTFECDISRALDDSAWEVFKWLGVDALAF